ncbi:MAG: tripartite tricarboxylate transporter TctB family protein [Christensenellales bacterium]|jgi:hypothetical protein
MNHEKKSAEKPIISQDDEKRDAFGQTKVEDNQAHLDFLASIILIIVCIAIVIICQGYYKQQLSRRIVTTFYESTGFMPTVFAAFLLIMSVIQLIGSLRKDGFSAHTAQLVKSFKATMVSRKFWKAVGGLVIFAIYVYGLLSRMSFGVASFIVLYTTMMYAHWESRKNLKTWLKMGIIALFASAGIVILFQYIFSVPMP